MKTVVLTAFFVGHRSGTLLLAEVLLEWLFCIMAELCLFLLLVADPGFTAEPTDLSCRCTTCRVEVEDFDHHCGVLGVCVGKGNMCYFILFLLFASLLCLLGGFENALYIASLVATCESTCAVSSRVSLEGCAAAIRDTVGYFPLMCHALLSIVAVYGGSVCVFLCLRYIHLCNQGKSSVRRRRRESLRGSLSLVFANVFRPHFSHHYQFVTAYAAREMPNISKGA
ncbi:hypothetical protein ABL78_2685 [Leptomonas seymouri]|uniref:Palmitoyltransferase n=1 Tax=Leptomonas seymouri TaxID=5684 RepID=A0A0N1I0L0_LEPSE|nr:hypothetical protein ABL78_2685 [Leptomonas seymouri]|eukprot:KPI88261.1 hypothetical protein ABL78_2685 [Leptomonas seymouri]